MYWYPFSEEEEDKAEAQADTQADGDAGRKRMKFIGNLGEIVINQFFEEYAGGQWSYLNHDSMEDSEEEYSDVDFKIGNSGLTLDVKSTTDIRKFDPVSMYFEEDAERPPAQEKDGYPKVDVDSVDVFVFVYISYARDISPESDILSPADVRGELDDLPAGSRNRIINRSGNRVAAILGWVYSKEFFGEMVGNMNQDGRGKFTRMATRDMNELLMRTDALPT